MTLLQAAAPQVRCHGPQGLREAVTALVERTQHRTGAPPHHPAGVLEVSATAHRGVVGPLHEPGQGEPADLHPLHAAGAAQADLPALLSALIPGVAALGIARHLSGAHPWPRGQAYLVLADGTVRSPHPMPRIADLHTPTTTGPGQAADPPRSGGQLLRRATPLFDPWFGVFTPPDPLGGGSGVVPAVRMDVPGAGAVLGWGRTLLDAQLAALISGVRALTGGPCPGTGPSPALRRLDAAASAALRGVRPHTLPEQPEPGTEGRALRTALTRLYGGRVAITAGRVLPHLHLAAVLDDRGRPRGLGTGPSPRAAADDALRAAVVRDQLDDPAPSGQPLHAPALPWLLRLSSQELSVMLRAAGAAQRPTACDARYGLIAEEVGGA